jgi:prevent-host-death family protein
MSFHPGGGHVIDWLMTSQYEETQAMPTVTAFQAKTRFGELIDRVSKGEKIVIPRHENPVARIIP